MPIQDSDANLKALLEALLELGITLGKKTQSGNNIKYEAQYGKVPLRIKIRYCRNNVLVLRGFRGHTRFLLLSKGYGKIQKNFDFHKLAFEKIS